MTLSLQKNYIDVSTHLYTISHYINLHALEHTGMSCIILPYFSVTKYGKFCMMGMSVYLLILVCHYACFVTLKQGKIMSKSMPGCKIWASQYNNIMASYINWYSVSTIPKNNMLSSYDVLDLSILNHLRYYFHYIRLSICWYNCGVIHSVTIFQHSHVKVQITPGW